MTEYLVSLINMKGLELFLKALENAFSNKRGFYVYRLYSKECKFPAYKNFILEVWCIDGECKTLVSKIDITEKHTTLEEKQNIEDKLTRQTMENVLKYYGI